MGELRGTKRDGVRGRAHAVAAAERGATGALPLLGAPLLAVIATFVLQPKASGSYQDGALAFDASDSEARPTSEARSTSDAPLLAFADPEPATQLEATGSPWVAVQQALDAKRFDVARSLLAGGSEREAHEHRQAYTMMLECLERPSNDATAAAYRFYLEGAPADVRSELFKTCVSSP